MNSPSEALPREIEAEARELISELGVAGWTFAAFKCDGDVFGYWYVDLCRSSRTLRLVKDRSQYMIDGPPTQEMKDVAFGRHLIRLGNFVVWSANGRDYRKTIANAAYADISQRM